MTVHSCMKAGLLAGVACTALFAAASGANAGGFAIREQSAEFQGMSFAGNAAGGSLSSMFWNSAAAAARDGTNFESSYSALMPRSEVTVDKVTVNPTGGPGFGALPGGSDAAIAGAYGLTPASADGIAPTALVAASYGNYQVSRDIYIGLGVNAPFGLTTEPNRNYKASTLAETTRLIAFNFNPTVAWKIMPGVTIGAGAQIQTAEATLRFLAGQPFNGSFSDFEGNGWGFGATAGILIEPMAGTTFGVGYRSRMTQELEGYFHSEAPGGNSIHAKANLELPDIVTVSLKQVVSPVMRVAGTFEWTNWSRFESLTLTATDGGRGPLNIGLPVAAGTSVASIPQNWSNSWFISGGVEYDVTPTLTARAGYAYEKSPVDDPTKRSPGIPDADRHWVSLGATWKALANTSLDFAWSHVFIAEERFDRNTNAPDLVPSAYSNIQGTVKSSLDIVSVGLKTKF